MKNFNIAGLIAIISYGVFAENPIINHMYTADPGALVYKDTFYIFTGHDEGSTGYVMHDWYVYSSTDMVHWTDHGPKLKVSDFSWAERDAWASQVIEKNGKFYWYVSVQLRGGKGVGVAVADHPLGPYKDARGSALITNQMTTNTSISWDDIDPTAFVDDDGQVYLYWGNTSCKGVKLKSDMINTDGPFTYFTLQNFTEAPWLHKRNNVYYLSYAAGWPELIDYATSSSPMGPWTRRGRLLNERLPSETSHQAIVQFKDKWYFVYHNAGLAGGGPYKRSVCIDELFYNNDGTIKPVVMTIPGVTPQAPSPFKAGKFLLTCKNSDKVLEVANSSMSNGGNVQQNQISSTTIPADNQLWSFDSIGTGVYRIVNLHSGLCLGTTSNSISDAANVEQQTINTNSNMQKWKPVGAGNNYYAFVNMASGKCLDVLDFSKQNGANVIVYSYLRTENQQWLLEDKSATAVVKKNRDAIHSSKLSVIMKNGNRVILVSSANNDMYTHLAITDLQGKNVWSCSLTDIESGTIQVQVDRKLPKGLYIAKLHKSRSDSKILKFCVK